MFYITISNGLIKDGHRQRMGSAVWEFMWLIDKITRIDHNGNGHVLGGKPINLDDISKDLMSHNGTISENLTKLESEGYIERLHTPYGIVIKVKKAKKRFNQNTNPNSEKTKPRSEKTKPNKTVSIDSINKTERSAEGAGVSSKEFQSIIDMFKIVDPNHERFFKNKTERAALERLVAKHGVEKITNTIKFLPTSNAIKYAPTITSPVDLERNLGRLIAWHRKEKSLQNKGRGIA